MKNIHEKKIGIIGLGYVGLPLAVEFGKNRETLGFDIQKQRISELRLGIDSTLEVAKEDINAANRLEFTSSREKLKECSIYIITVPTPIDGANRPNLQPIIRASETVAENLKDGDIVIYESTVFPGCTEEICVPVLEKISGLIYNKDFYCGYSPERINPGDKINTLTKIVKITSGSTEDSATEIDNLYKSIITAGTFKATSIAVAEAAKVIENTQRDLNIALVNELAIIFNLIGIDTLDVLKAAESKWNFLKFRPGLVGGHCIGVDPYYLTHKAEELGYNPQVILAGRRINDNMAEYATKSFIQQMIKNKVNVSSCVVGILGITFKENCPDIRNSKVIDIIDELKKWDIEFKVVDSWANPEEVKDLHGIDITNEISSLKKVDSLIVAVGHNEYRSLTTKELRNICNDNPVIADVKSLYSKTELIKQGFSVTRL